MQNSRMDNEARRIMDRIKSSIESSAISRAVNSDRIDLKDKFIGQQVRGFDGADGPFAIFGLRSGYLVAP